MTFHVIEQIKILGKELRVVGLMNVQFAIRGDEIFILEVNPRASRTVPFIAKAIGLPLARWGVDCMLGIPLSDERLHLLAAQLDFNGYYAVKQPVFPFNKFPGVDPLLGPEMHSTGETMGVAVDFGRAYFRAQWGAGKSMPTAGCAFLSVREADKKEIMVVAKKLMD